MKKTIILLFLSLSLSSPVFAGKGYDFYQQGDYKSAAIEWTKQAKNGNPIAQNNLAQMYRDGEGVNKNLKQAFYWFQKSADQGNASATSSLGYCYYFGKGTTKNYNKALEQWRKAIKLGNKRAEYWLGRGYYDVGEFYLAAEMFKDIAWEGDTSAQFMMGQMYERGEHFDKDIDAAKRWYSKASLSEYKKATQALRRIENREKNKKAQAEIAEKNRKAEIAEQNRLAKIAETKRQAEIAEQNRLARIAKAKKELEIAKQKRIGLKAYNEGNYALALKELYPVAKSGDAEAQKIYGTIAYKGTATKDKNFEISLIWLNRAAIQGQLDAYWTIADIYSKGGYGVLKNPRKAFDSYEKLARKGNSRAQHKIGLLYLNGTGVEKSLKDASYWVQKSFDNDGNKDAEKTWNKYKLWNY
jgi:uncharacterized protein